MQYLWPWSTQKSGIKRLAKNRDVIAQRMTPAQIAEAQKLAREWTPKPNAYQLSDMH
jgi:uncharacterized protein